MHGIGRFAVEMRCSCRYIFGMTFWTTSLLLPGGGWANTYVVLRGTALRRRELVMVDAVSEDCERLPKSGPDRGLGSAFIGAFGSSSSPSSSSAISTPSSTSSFSCSRQHTACSSGVWAMCSDAGLGGCKAPGLEPSDRVGAGCFWAVKADRSSVGRRLTCCGDAARRS